MYGNILIIGHIYNNNSAYGGYVVFKLSSVSPYINQTYQNSGSLPNFNGNQAYKYYGWNIHIHNHIIFITGDGNTTYVYHTV